jgi:NADPH-dependent glutamate synthase beta subunit-like oxidoreductase
VEDATRGRHCGGIEAGDTTADCADRQNRRTGAVEDCQAARRVVRRAYESVDCAEPCPTTEYQDKAVRSRKRTTGLADTGTRGSAASGSSPSVRSHPITNPLAYVGFGPPCCPSIVDTSLIFLFESLTV